MSKKCFWCKKSELMHAPWTATIKVVLYVDGKEVSAFISVHEKDCQAKATDYFVEIMQEIVKGEKA